MVKWFNFIVLFFFVVKVDFDNEFVWYFLIEMIKKGVWLKGYNDELVFGKFWLNIIYLFGGSLVVKCFFLKDVCVVSEFVKDEVLCGWENWKNSNVGMDL